MRTNSDVNKIWGNITSPNGKARTILATMHKGVAANGMAIVLSLFEVLIIFVFYKHQTPYLIYSPPKARINNSQEAHRLLIFH